MAFCTNCGAQTDDQARFCPKCGTALPGGASTTFSTNPMVSQEPLHYEIQGANLQVVRCHLTPGQALYAEAGKMVYKTANVAWETKMQGDGIGSKIWGAVKRKLMGESLFMTYFKSSGNGEVGVAGTYPGRVQPGELRRGQSILVQRDSFLCAQTAVQLNIALVKKLGSGFFGGEGFILQKITGPGIAFIHGGGDFVEFQLGPWLTILVDTGGSFAFDESVNHDIQFVGVIKTAIFGGEGLFLATLTGPGRAIIQSMTLEKMRRELGGMASASGGDATRPLGAISSIFSDD